jgi:hypothetical protein
MTCDEARGAMDALLDGEMEPAGEESLRAHLSSCDACLREIAERRAFSSSLRNSFGRALEDVGSTPGERHALVERLHAAARRRALFPARLAAAVMAGLAVGIAAWASGLVGPRPEDPERRAVAAIACEEAARHKQIDLLRREAALDLLKAREVADRGGENPAVRLASLQVSSLEELLAPAPAAGRRVADLVADTAASDLAVRGAARKALRQLPPAKLDELRRAATEVPRCDRAWVGQVITELEDRARPAVASLISISRNENGTTVEFRQHGDGRVELSVPGFRVEARSVRELMNRHPDVCRRYGVAGREGAVVVGDRAASVDLGGQVNLMFRTGAWNEGVQWDAYRAWISGRVPDAAEVEQRVKGLQEQCLQAARPPAAPQVAVDVQGIVQGVRKMTEEQLRENRQRLERRMKELQERLREAQELRARARSLRVYAETVDGEK